MRVTSCCASPVCARIAFQRTCTFVASSRVLNSSVIPIWSMDCLMAVSFRTMPMLFRPSVSPIRPLRSLLKASSSARLLKLARS